MSETKKAATKTDAKPETKTADKGPGFKPVVKKALTLPLLKLEFDDPVYVKVITPIFKGKEIKGTGDAAKMEPADLVEVINLATGEHMQMIAGAVMKGVFEDNYSGTDYVGECFQISKHKKEGKRYHDYKVLLIEDPTA